MPKPVERANFEEVMTEVGRRRAGYHDEIPHLRTSERKTFKRCPQQWEWEWYDGLTVGHPRPDARWFGTGIHLALAERYKYRGMRRGRNVLGVWRDFVGDSQAAIRVIEDEGTAAKWVDALELGEAMLGGYLDAYGKDERWYVLAAEQTFELPIPYPKRLVTADTDLSKPLVYYNGTFDSVRRDLENEGSLWVWENKSAGSIQLGHLGKDDQGGSYWAVAADVLREMGISIKGEMLEGIMYDFLRKAYPDTRPLDSEGRARNKPQKRHYADAFAGSRIPQKEWMFCKTLDQMAEVADKWKLVVFGDVSERGTTPNFHREPIWRTRAERRKQIERIQDEAIWINAVRSGMLPVIKNPGDAINNHCNYCDFNNMCELHEQSPGNDWKEFRDATFVVADPYEAHRQKSTAE